MYKNVQTNREIANFNTTLMLLYIATRGKLKIGKGNEYHFIHQAGTFPTGTMRLVVKSSGMWEAYTQTCPKWDKRFTIACWCRSIIACQVSWILDEICVYQNLKTTYIYVCGRVTVAGCLTYIPISCMGPMHATKDTNLNFQATCMH